MDHARLGDPGIAALQLAERFGLQSGGGTWQPGESERDTVHLKAPSKGKQANKLVKTIDLFHLVSAPFVWNQGKATHSKVGSDEVLGLRRVTFQVCQALGGGSMDCEVPTAMRRRAASLGAWVVVPFSPDQESG